ncbi:RING-H2 finger protein ATL22-like [Daucus carota subsp. sativus]
MGLITSLTMCKIILSSLIPVPRPTLYDDTFSSDLRYDLELTWSMPNCEECEKHGALCHFKNATSRQPTCSYEPKAGGIHVIKIIALCITVPAVVASMTIATFICFSKGPDAHHQDAELALQTVNDSEGLDESTIESYTKVVIGESRRLPAGPNDVTCPICLSDYHANEKLSAFLRADIASILSASMNGLDGKDLSSLQEFTFACTQ